jgi:hypothetical protein
MKLVVFPYAFWIKILGLLIVAAGVLIYFIEGTSDINQLAMVLSWGFIFIFFSKEKVDDEMIQGLKFRSLAYAVIIAFSITHLYNYLFLNLNFRPGYDRILSVSAYQFLAFTLIIATANFYYMKRRSAISEGE